jgi:tetratricopeptide (TPR) repeat protein
MGETHSTFSELLDRGEEVREKGNPADAIKILGYAMLKASTNREKSTVLRHIGLCHEHLRELKEALVYYHKALNLAKANEDKENIARALRHLLSVKVTEGKYNEALALGYEARDLYAQLDVMPTDAVWITHGLVKAMIKSRANNRQQIQFYVLEETKELFYMLPREKKSLRKKVWLTGWMMDVYRVSPLMGIVLFPIALLIVTLSGLRLRRDQLIGRL